MMPVEWPVAASFSGQRMFSRVPVHARLETVRRDFFLDPRDRLNECERALMGAMLRALVGDVAAELRAALPAGWAAANDSDDHALYEGLLASGALDLVALIEALLRRADEEGFTVAAFARASRRPVKLVPALVSHDNGPVAAAAMALVVARGRRRDSSGQILLALDDLDARTANDVMVAVAAGLRPGLAAIHGTAAADLALAQAAGHLAQRHDPERGLDRLTGELVAMLDSAGRCDDPLLTAAAAEGELAFVAHALARRAGIDPADCASELLSGDQRRAMVLLRMSGASRDLAAGLLAAAGDLFGIVDGSEAITTFDSLGTAEVEARRAWLASPPAYRAAVEITGADEGHRG